MDWLGVLFGGAAAGALSGALTGMFVHEYQARRNTSTDRQAAAKELFAAFLDIKAYWAEASPRDLTSIERENLIAAVDILRDSLIRHSPRLPLDAVAAIQQECAALRASFATPEGHPESIRAHLLRLEGILPAGPLR